MFMNLDTLPRGKSLFTAYVTLDPAGTDRSAMSADEVDIVAPRSSGKRGVLEDGVENDGGVNAGVYIHATYGENARVVGITNQSDGFVVYDGFLAGDETGRNDL